VLPCRIKSQFKVPDVETNPGVVISPRTTHVPYHKLTVKLVVVGDFITEPMMFTCDGSYDSLLWLVWRSGNGVGRSNKVKLRRARLVLGLVKCGGVYHPDIHPGHSGHLSRFCLVTYGRWHVYLPDCVM